MVQRHLPPDQQLQNGALLPLRKHQIIQQSASAKLYQGLKVLHGSRADIAANGLTSVRELTGGIYSSRAAKVAGWAKSVDTEVYHRFEIERIVRIDGLPARRHRVTNRQPTCCNPLFWRRDR